LKGNSEIPKITLNRADLAGCFAKYVGNQVVIALLDAKPCLQHRLVIFDCGESLLAQNIPLGQLTE
jgi:hypothetical protein